MYRIGIDVGSTYTKFCVASERGELREAYAEKTPVEQKQYFQEKCAHLKETYPDSVLVSCGYGKKNIPALQRMNELTALARGAFFAAPDIELVLDIGGQDTKVISQREGKLKGFFMNDKCAAGSGMFFENTRKLLGIAMGDIDLTGQGRPAIALSSVCAVFAQSEIVELIADNYSGKDILYAVIWQILVKARPLLDKGKEGPVLLSGGMTQIKGMESYAELALERRCRIVENSLYLSAIGCTL